ncbi:MAG: HD domain-containing phosphohydrolase [Gemmatimonadaceae bacterium]
MRDSYDGAGGISFLPTLELPEPASTTGSTGGARCAADEGAPARRVDPRARVLIVDDEESVRRPLATYFGRHGYGVQTAESGAEALRILRDVPCTAMIADVRMPGMSGLDLVPEALAIDPDLAILMLSGVDSAVSATQAMHDGAFDYLVKPLDLPEVERALRKALHRRDLQLHQRRIEDRIRDEVDERTHELEQEKGTLKRMTVSIAEALVSAMEAKIPLLAGHSHRVAASAAAIAEEMQLDPDLVELVRQAGQLHDIGKIGVPEALLNELEPLTPLQVEHVREHVRIGLEILAPLPHLAEVCHMIQDHHEHWDGSGYPRRLRGDAISLGGRIIRAADAFEWLTTNRPHRQALGRSEALQALAFYAGRALDPEVYAALERAFSRNTQMVFLD